MFLFVCILLNSKTFHAYFYKKKQVVFLSYFKKYKNQLMGIIISLWLSISIWPKFQKHHIN